MPSPGQAKRISRIRRRAIPEVREAYERGLITAKRADLLLYLSPAEQAAELTRRLEEARIREEKHGAVAGVIRGYLDQLGGRRVDLNELAQRIREALGFAKS
jgi:hypothetical protein